MSLRAMDHRREKRLPSFNEFSMQNVVQITRKLQVSRPDINSPPNATNQMYVFSITNSLGLNAGIHIRMPILTIYNNGARLFLDCR